MPSNYNIKDIHRVIDANINRAKEGLRVCEEITRFILNSYKLTEKLKDIRHRIDQVTLGLPAKSQLLKQRNALSDIGRNIYAGELKRRGCADIFFANIQRVKESLRVLEEFTKLKNIPAAREFKKLRYRVYFAEQKIAQRLLPDK